VWRFFKIWRVLQYHHSCSKKSDRRAPVGVLVKKSIWLPRYTFAGWIGYLIAGFIGACILIASLARACGGLQQRKPVPSLPVMFSTAKLIFDLHLAWRRQLLKNHILFQIDDRSKFETQKGLIFSFVLFGMGFPSSAIVKFMRQLVTNGGSMPAILLRQTAHPSQLSSMAITAITILCQIWHMG
jgi:hypothetical protein